MIDKLTVEVTQEDFNLLMNAKKKKAEPKVRKEKKLPVAITKEEFTELIKKTNKEHHKIAFLLGFGAGLRISEVTTLLPRNINISNKTITIEQGKGSKDRIVPLPKGFQAKHIKLFPLKCGVRALQRAFISAAKRSGLKEAKPTIHFHSLRHGFATQMVSNGVPIHHVRTLMGHSNISTTNVYLEANPKEALKSYEELF